MVPRLLVLLLCVGCGSAGSEQPFPTYEVKGKVVSKATGKPLTEGMVEFVHKQDSHCNCGGTLDAQGNFTLATIAGNKTLPGAGEGEYTVTYRLMRPDQSSFSFIVKQSVRIKAEPNTITIEVDKTP